MNSKLFVFKMLNRFSIKEVIEDNKEESVAGFGGETEVAEPEETANEPEMGTSADNSSSGFGGDAGDMPEEPSIGSGSNTMEDDNSGENSESEMNPENKDEDKPKEEKKEKNSSETAVDEFKELSEQTEDPYDLLKFFKAKFTDLEPDDFNKFLSKIVKDKEFRHKPEIKDALLKLKIFFAS